MKNTMLESVLSKLIECMSTYNEHVMQGPPSAASHYLYQCDLLVECLRGAGYMAQFAAKGVVVTEGMYRGNRGRMFTCVGFNVPEISENDIEAFRTVGFQWLWEEGVMKYEFVNSRKEEKAWVS